MKYEPKRDIEHLISSKTLINVIPSLHFHKSIELNYAIKGALKVQLGLHMQTFTPGEIAFIPSYIPHSVAAVGETVSENLIIPFQFFKKFEQNDVPLQFFKLDDTAINAKLFTIISAIKNYIDTPQKILLQGLIYVLLGSIVEHYPQNQLSTKEDSMIIQIIEFIEGNFKSNLTLDLLASKFGYSKYHFSKLFHKYFNCNLKTYINNIRLNYIEDNLKTEKTTTLINDAGFNTLSTFYRLKKNLRQ